MHDSEELSNLVSFFSSNIVQTLLQRYDYTEDQSKKIDRAVREAKTKEPNIILLRQADEIMNSVAKSQKKSFSRELTEDEKRLLKNPHIFNSEKMPKENKNRWLMRFIYFGVALLLLNIAYKSVQ